MRQPYTISFTPQYKNVYQGTLYTLFFDENGKRFKATSRNFNRLHRFAQRGFVGLGGEYGCGVKISEVVGG